jgi:glycosyltransferase involved in cell wall biosynthesis
MKIAFLLGSPEISGGTYVIFEHATRLQAIGHTVIIVTEEIVTPQRYAWHPEAGRLLWRSLEEVRNDAFDFVIATWWHSVEKLGKLHARKYVYFVQSIESRFLPPQDPEIYPQRDIDIINAWCEDTYALNVPVITEAHWIQSYLFERYNRLAAIVRNGIRKDIYCADGPAYAARREGNLRVLVEGPLGVSYKNVEKTIELCRRAEVDEIWLLTSSEVTDYPRVNRCFSRVPITETAAIYRSCDLLVKLSYVEGMFGPPLEMFHCGGTALVYDVTGHDEYIRHQQNSIVVPRDDEASVINWLKRLQESPALMASLKGGAEQTAHDWPDWDVATKNFHDALSAYDEQLPDVAAGYVDRYNKQRLAMRIERSKARELERFVEREQEVGLEGAGFRNFIQVYWDCGNGLEAELTAPYMSGTWQTCTITVPVWAPLQMLRVDPSVRIGVVELRTLSISGVSSKKVYDAWQQGGSWANLHVTGTARVLRMTPYPVLFCYGEDPGLAIPLIGEISGEESVQITVELCEKEVTPWLDKAASRTSLYRFVARVLTRLTGGNQ